MSAGDVQTLRARVVKDANLRDGLDALDEEACIARLVELAREAALDVTAEDVRRVMDEARRRWLERWI